MRVIGGVARGRKLREPVGISIRPTGDMVKESVFNIIQFDIEGRRVLDLFAGTGQLGIEALSRGAKSAVFVDLKPEAIKLIRENVKICGFTELASVYNRDAIRYICSDETFDIIFLDPPYNTSLIDKIISKIIEFDKLNLNGIIICEMKADTVIPDKFPLYFSYREYIYGNVKIVRFDREN